MTDAISYWSPLCMLVTKLRCWVRVASKKGAETVTTRWGQLLAIPSKGYLESPGAVLAIADVEWIEISTSRILGGIAGRPRRLVDIKEDILSGLREAGIAGELREASWSVEGVIDDEPVQVVRVTSAFGPR